MSQNLSSAAVLIGALRVNIFVIFYLKLNISLACRAVDIHLKTKRVQIQKIKKNPIKQTAL